MWRLIQLLIVFGVVGSNIEWKWTDNPLAATVVGVVVAFVVTDLGTAFWDLLVRWNAAARRFFVRHHAQKKPSASVAPSREFLDARNALLARQKKLR